MSSSNSEREEWHDVAPVVGDAEEVAGNNDAQPIPVPDDDFAEAEVEEDEIASQSWVGYQSEGHTQGSSRASESWEKSGPHVDSQAEEETFNETLKSEFSDESDDSPLQTVAPQESLEDDLDLWSDDEEKREPPPRPTTQLQPSAKQKQKKRRQEPRVDPEEEQEYIDAAAEKLGINNLKTANRGLPEGVSHLPKGRGKRTADLRYMPGPSRLNPHRATHTSSPTSEATLSGTGTTEGQGPLDDTMIYVAHDHESDQSGHEPNAEGFEAADADQAGQSVDDPSLAAVREAGSVQSRADDHQTRSTETELQKRNLRSASPIAGFYDEEDAKDYDKLRNEFDALSRDQPELSSESASRPHVVEEGNSAETPPTPTSAESLEHVTGLSLKDGRHRFERLKALAESRVMQDPQRALEMKRQMLLYVNGRQNNRVFSTNKEGAKVKAKAKAAWASAAAHYYRDERERAKGSANQWERYAKTEHDFAQKYESGMRSAERAAQIAQEDSYYLQQEVNELQKELYKLEGEKEQVQQEKAKAEAASQCAHHELDALRAARQGDHSNISPADQDELESLRKEKERMDKIKHRITPLWERMRNQRENGPPREYGRSLSRGAFSLNHADSSHSAATQTSPTLSPMEQAASTQQSENIRGQENGKQTSDETDVSLLSEEELTGSRTDAGTQTIPQQADESQRNARSSARNAQATIPLLPFDIDDDLRPALIPAIANWINECHENNGGDSSVQQATSERIESLVDSETTYSDFVSALEHDGLLFRPDHLACEIQRVINAGSLGAIPLAVLQNIYRIDLDPRSLQRDLGRLYEEIAERQEEVNHLRNYNFYAPTLDASPDAMAAVQIDRANLEVELRQTMEALKEAEAKIDTLKANLRESEAIVAQLTDERTRSPSQESEKSEEAGPSNEQADKLKDNLRACREHGEQLQKSLDDADSEKEKLQISIQECREHRKELGAANEQLGKDAALWKLRFEEMEAANLEQVDQITRLQFKSGELPEGLSDDEDDGETETADEKDTLRAKVERLEAENERLPAASICSTNNETTSSENETQRLRNELALLQADQEAFALSDNTSTELKRLRKQNKDLQDQNVRYNTMLTFVRVANEEAQKKTKKKSLAASAALPMPLPETPALTAGIPSPAPPVTYAITTTTTTTPPHWQDRETRIHNTLSFRQTRANVYQAILDLNGIAEQEQELAEERELMETRMEREELKRAARWEKILEMQERIEREREVREERMEREELERWETERRWLVARGEEVS